MDQRADRGRSFHRVRQPDVEGELSGFSDRAAENQQRDEGGAGANGEKSRVLQATAALVVKQKGAAAVIKPKHPQEKAEIADAGGDESFPGGGGRARPLDPESNEQIGRESDQFPANEK